MKLLLRKPPTRRMKTNGGTLSDDGNNVVWYQTRDGDDYEFHVQSGEWFRLCNEVDCHVRCVTCGDIPKWRPGELTTYCPNECGVTRIQ